MIEMADVPQRLLILLAEYRWVLVLDMPQHLCPLILYLIDGAMSLVEVALVDP